MKQVISIYFFLLISLMVHALLFLGGDVGGSVPQGRPIVFVSLAPISVTSSVGPAAPESHAVQPTGNTSSARNQGPDSDVRSSSAPAFKPLPESLIAVRQPVVQHSSLTDNLEEKGGGHDEMVPDGEVMSAISSYVDPSPEPGVNPVPEYPAIAVRRGWEGEVLLRVLVSAAGDAGEVLVEKSSGFALLDDAAAAAVRGWRFVPASEGGESVPGEVLLPVRFALRRSGR